MSIASRILKEMGEEAFAAWRRLPPVGETIAMALDAPASLALNRLFEAIDGGASAVAGWMK